MPSASQANVGDIDDETAVVDRYQLEAIFLLSRLDIRMKLSTELLVDSLGPDHKLVTQWKATLPGLVTAWKREHYLRIKFGQYSSDLIEAYDNWNAVCHEVHKLYAEKKGDTLKHACVIGSLIQHARLRMDENGVKYRNALTDSGVEFSELPDGLPLLSGIDLGVPGPPRLSVFSENQIFGSETEDEAGSRVPVRTPTVTFKGPALSFVPSLLASNGGETITDSIESGTPWVEAVRSLSKSGNQALEGIAKAFRNGVADRASSIASSPPKVSSEYDPAVGRSVGTTVGPILTMGYDSNDESDLESVCPSAILIFPKQQRPLRFVTPNSPADLPRVVTELEGGVDSKTFRSREREAVARLMESGYVPTDKESVTNSARFTAESLNTIVSELGKEKPYQLLASLRELSE